MASAGSASTTRTTRPSGERAHPPPPAEPPAALPLPLPTLAAQIAARVGCNGIGPWLHRLAATLHLPAPTLMPEPAIGTHGVALPHAGLTLELGHPHAAAVQRGDPDRWVIVRAVFDAAWPLPWPFDLDPHESRYPLVMARLPGDSMGLRPRDLAAGDLRQSILLPGGRVVGLTWRPAGLGFERMELVRMGRAETFEGAPG
jgi:hypothetical protein